LIDVLLIQPPVRDFYFTTKRTVPYGLASIAATLLEKNISVSILDACATNKSRETALPEEMEYLNDFYSRDDTSPFALFNKYKHFGYSFQHIGNMAKKSGASIVGISSLFTAYSYEALKCAEIVKKALPGCVTVMGGHHPTAMPELVMKCKNIDFLIRGEGEVSMPLLVKSIKNNLPLDNIPGIVSRKDDGSLHINEPVVMKEPDDYPPPAMELVKNSFYTRNKRGSAVVVAARGCPMKCTYCSLGSGWPDYRKRSAMSVIREIDTVVKKYNAGFIDFEDENLSFDRKRFMEILENIHIRFHKYDLELRAMNGLFPPSIDDEMVQAMKKAGFKTLNLSLGSSSADQQKRFNRPDITKAFQNVIKYADNAGLKTVTYIIAGAPHQSAEDSIQDLIYLARTKTLAGVSVFYPAPMSADYVLCESLELLPSKLSLMRSSAIPISHKTTRFESVTIMRLGRILNFMKSLIDKGITIPEPESFGENKSMDACSREEAGLQLLKWFLADGRIRGVAGNNEIFEHTVSNELSSLFAEKLKAINLQGAGH